MLRTFPLSTQEDKRESLPASTLHDPETTSRPFRRQRALHRRDFPRHSRERLRWVVFTVTAERRPHVVGQIHVYGTVVDPRSERSTYGHLRHWY
jgi:hypothetical protein